MQIIPKGFVNLLKSIFQINHFRTSVIESVEPISPRSFKSVFSFGKAIFQYNKFAILLYLLLCTLRSMEYLFRNLPFKRFISTIENFDPNGDAVLKNVLVKPFILILVSVLAIELFYRLSAVLLAYIVRPNIEYTVTRKVTAFLMRKPYNFFSKNPTSINNRIHQLAEGTYDATIMLIEESIPSSLGALGTIMAIAFINKYIGIILMIYFIIHAGLVVIFYSKYIRLSSCNALSHNTLIRQSLNLVQNMSQAKAFGAEKFEMGRINIFQSRRRKMNQIALSYPERMKLLLTFNHTATFILVLCLQVHFLLKGTFGVSDITFVTSNMYGIISLLHMATNASVKVVEDIGRCSEGVRFFKQSINENELHLKKKYPKKLKNSSIIFNNVTFQYPYKKALFENQSITIKPKEKIGIVGLSGSGKSTFVNLIMGYFLPSKGSVVVGGYDVSKTDISWLRQHITMMSQNPHLFDRTIIENLQYGNPLSKYNEIHKLCKKLGTDEFVSELNYGYYTSVIDGGVNLSGGQKQRIALSRAVAKDSEIVILDEATSAMDSHTQSIINKGMQTLLSNKTAIVIAHKLETVMNMNRILVFQGGRIVESGSHNDLIKQKDSYYSYLWKLSSSNSYKP